MSITKIVLIQNFRIENIKNNGIYFKHRRNKDFGQFYLNKTILMEHISTSEIEYLKKRNSFILKMLARQVQFIIF